MIRLGVNIDHVATLRQARQTNEPDPVYCAGLAELGGADQITIHLREDRRHIQDRDVRLLREIVKVRLNLELGLNDEIIDIALATRPDQVCIVPENRKEITTEGGLNLLKSGAKAKDAIARFHEVGVAVSAFIDPDLDQLSKALEIGCDAVEFHTGRFANARPGQEQDEALNALLEASALTNQMIDGDTAPASLMEVNLGHGLTYRNLPTLLEAILPNPLITELNIGHSIMARAIQVGMVQAVREMRDLIRECETQASLLALNIRSMGLYDEEELLHMSDEEDEWLDDSDADSDAESEPTNDDSD